MAQASFAELEHDLKKRRTRRELFLEKMDKLVPWERLERRIEPFYAKAGRGRRPYPLSVMPRVHCVQLFYNLSDPGMEDLLYEVESVRRFVGLRLTEALPDETTILNFRHLLEKHGLGEGLFEEINAHLASRGHRLRTGTIVDASIIDAPSSTKNRRRARDPEMHRTKKGKQWYFGMKAHIGVDAGSGLAHSLTTTAANASDVTQAGALLHGAETTAWGDAGYQGVEKRPEHRDGGVEWRVAMKPGRRRLLGEGVAEEAAEKRKASVRAKVEHPFLYVKRHFGYPMQHEPSRFLRHLQVAVELHRGHAFEAGHLQVDSKRPFPQRHLRPLHRGPHPHRKAAAAGRAPVRHVARSLGCLGATATRAMTAGRPDIRLEPCGRRRLIGEHIAQLDQAYTLSVRLPRSLFRHGQSPSCLSVTLRPRRYMYSICSV